MVVAQIMEKEKQNTKQKILNQICCTHIAPDYE